MHFLRTKLLWTPAPSLEKDEDHPQDPLTKDLLHIWSWFSQCLLPRGRERDESMTKISSRKTCYTYGHGPVIILSHNCLRVWMQVRGGKFMWGGGQNSGFGLDRTGAVRGRWRDTHTHTHTGIQEHRSTQERARKSCPTMQASLPNALLERISRRGRGGLFP